MTAPSHRHRRARVNLSLEERRGLTGPALRVFFNIARVWQLNDPEQMRLLGVGSHATLRRWRTAKVKAVSHDTLERVSHLLAIYRAINELLPADRADAWLRRPNAAPPFGGAAALERMTAGRVVDLIAVRAYLEGELIR